MTDSRLSGSFSGDHHELTIGGGPASGFFQRIVLNQDPPAHTRVRRLMGGAFTPTLARELTPRITRIVNDLLDPALRAGRFDAVRDLGYPLPLRVLGALVGIPDGDLAEVGARAMEVAKAFAAVLGPEDRATAHASVEWLYGYIGRLLAARRAAPGDDLLSRLLAAGENGDRLSEQEIVENVIFTLFAGFETTMSTIATGCKALLDQPDQLARLRADPALIPTAVEEFLRFDAPIQVKLRIVVRPIPFAGRVLRPGRVVVLLLGSANHDERQYADPGRVDVGRQPNHHQSFGGGHHRCIGAALARAEAVAAFDGIVRRFAKLEPAGPAVRQPRPGFRAYDAVPVTAVPG
jgi:cytochrome P450